jgi:hypothetical protein
MNNQSFGYLSCLFMNNTATIETRDCNNKYNMQNKCKLYCHNTYQP